MVNELFKAFMELPQVEAIALGGSRAGEVFDEKSDYDVYLYCTGEISPEEKMPILKKYCSYIEASNHFWELEDNCTLNNGIDIDILYRNIDDFGNDVASVVEDFQAHNGYTTCMWHNLLNCKIIYDENKRLEKLKERFAVPYSKQLKENIITNNMKLLYDYMPAYYFQIKKAIERADKVSINHRTSAFLESYFDVIYAVNELTHPGEKRLVSLSKKNCKILPNKFEENIDTLFDNLFSDGDVVMDTLKDMIEEIKKVIQ